MPGWNGIETIDHIRKNDREAEVIFITAYSEHSVDSISSLVGPNISYFIKPFASDELKQMATKAVISWNQASELKNLLSSITQGVMDKAQLNGLLAYLIEQLCIWLETDSSALIQIGESSSFDYLTGIGKFADRKNFFKMIDKNRFTDQIQTYLGEGSDEICFYENNLLIFPIAKFGLAIGLEGPRKLTSARQYIVRFYVIA